MSAPILSILICAVPARLTGSTARVFDELEKQAQGKPVEVLCLLDNKARSVGSKRNALVKIARGQYLVFVDDDDLVAPAYVSKILRAIDSSDSRSPTPHSPSPDLIVFDAWVTGYERSHGLADRLCRYDIDYQNENLPGEYHRQPNHLMCWRTAIARTIPFPDLSRGEDTEWAAAIIRRHPRLKQVRIAETLYYYQFNAAGSETAERRTSVTSRISTPHVAPPTASPAKSRATPIEGKSAASPQCQKVSATATPIQTYGGRGLHISTRARPRDTAVGSPGGEKS